MVQLSFLGLVPLGTVKNVPSLDWCPWVLSKMCLPWTGALGYCQKCAFLGLVPLGIVKNVPYVDWYPSFGT